VALHGALGAGKTAFVQGVARGLGVPASAAVVSPTFTIAREYAVPGDPPVVLHHVDAYRLGGSRELEAAGYEEMWGGGRVTCVEWSERVEDAMPADRLEIDIEPGPGTEDRTLRFRATGPESLRVLHRFARAAEARG
jgi:tRNA threonylcarbamoyladenosine biosynthesis protein TsaE